jgi:gamma-glutamylcysteine synthetase
MEGKLPSLPGEFPTLNDWENHLTEIYPEVCFLHLQSPFSEIFCF